MSNTSFSPEEWKAICAAPLAAGALMTFPHSGGRVGIAKQALVVEKAIAQSASGDAPDFIRTLAAHVRSGTSRLELPDIPDGDPSERKAALIALIKSAIGTIQTKSPHEVEAYKTWLASVTAKVAQATRAGRLSSDGAFANPGEQEALSQLAEVLGVGALQ